VRCQQRGHDREAGPDAGSAAVAAARTGTPSASASART
jgi:hypothetical protein